MLTLIKQLEITDHSRDKRLECANTIISTPNQIKDLLKIIALIDDNISCKAAWVLEFIIKSHPEIIIPYLDLFIKTIPLVYKDSAVRPLAKICECITTIHYHQKKILFKTSLTKKHRSLITESCFDWLISNQKVAVKAYSMTSLYLLGTEFEWIHPELKVILENNYNTGSAAYKARARIILKKIKR